MSKFSKLREMELKRYLDVRDATENWKDYTTKDRLTYIQKTFDYLNEYNSLKYGYDPREIKFGFGSGSDPTRSSAFYTPTTQSICMSFLHVVAGFMDAKIIDTTIRHEFRHFIQDRILNENAKGIKYDSRIVQPSYYHNASQNEIDADRSAIMGVIKSDFMGLIKSDTRVHAFKSFIEDAKLLTRNQIGHAKAQVAYLTKGKFFASKEDKEIQQNLENGNESQPITSPTGPLYYSYGQLCRLVDQSPEKFTSLKSFYEEGGLAKLKEYRESNLPLHRLTPFFGLAKEGFRDCGYTKLDENGNPVDTHEFDRYDKDGNLIDEEDKNAQYDAYTPQEVLGYEQVKAIIDENETRGVEETTQNEGIKNIASENPSKDIGPKDTDEGAPPPVS